MQLWRGWKTGAGASWAEWPITNWMRFLTPSARHVLRVVLYLCRWQCAYDLEANVPAVRFSSSSDTRDTRDSRDARPRTFATTANSAHRRCYIQGTTPATDQQCYNGSTAIPFVPVAGIICGMVGFGLMADCLGRRLGSRMTVSLMLLGSIMVTVAYGVNIAGQFAMFNVGMFIFSLGVGGEYPMAASSSSERAEHENIARGRTVSFTFANQGWGTLVNTAMILFMLAVTHTGQCTKAYSTNYTLDPATGNTTTFKNEYCNQSQLEVAWRVSFAIGIPFVLGLWIYRFGLLKESKMWADRKEQKYSDAELAAILLRRNQNTALLFSRKYLPRLTGAAGGWFLWDVAFYGNKLFQGTIITALVGKNSTLLITFEYTLLNSFIALIGYYVAAFTIDYPWMGRVRMQNMGFTIDAILFLVCGYMYTDLTNNHIPAFQAMYLLSSFFGQFGPNVTTWLLPVYVPLFLCF